MAEYSVRAMRGLATILDCVLRQKLNVELEEVQILNANGQLFLASNRLLSAGAIFDALNARMGANDFEPMMYLAWILHDKVLNAHDRISGLYQGKINITNPYGGDPAAWGAAWRNLNLQRALAIEKLAKVVVLRKMRAVGRFNDGYTEQNFKQGVMSYLGIDLNKADRRYIAFAVLMMGVDDSGINLMDEPGAGPAIARNNWTSADTAAAVLRNGIRFTIYNSDNYPYIDGEYIHAEQHLVGMLVDAARSNDLAFDASIGGKKVACGTCAPVMTRFINAYTEAFGVPVNDPDYDAGAQGGGAGGQLDYPADLAGGARFNKFIGYWQLPEGNVWHALEPLF